MNIIKNNAESLPVWLYKKEMHCPVCHRDFLDTYPRYTRLRMEYVESDFRPHYVSDIFPFYYDITVCNNCGYGMLTDRFSEITEGERMRIREEILPKFHSRSYPLLLSKEQAEEKYKLAQLSAGLMNLKDSEYAYFMLRCAWFYKEVKEKANIQPNAELDLDSNTLRCYAVAVEHFEKAYVAEEFPVRGMNELALAYLITVLNYRLQKMDKVNQWLRECYANPAITAKENQKMRDKINELRNLLKKERESDSLPQE